MKNQYLLIRNEGTLLVTTMLILLLISLFGKWALTASITENKIAANSRYQKKLFYAAEAGLEHMKERLQKEFSMRSRARIASGQMPDWDFALNGSVSGIQPARDTDFDNGAIWIMDQLMEDGSASSCSYSVTVWNNPDDKGGAINDTDQLITIRSVSLGSRGTRSSIEAILRSQNSGETITGYFAQAGASQNKSLDVNHMTDFSTQ